MDRKLPYLSTIFVREAETLCLKSGFDPMQGYLHESDWNRPALACDLVEGTRHRLEWLVAELFNSQTLSSCLFTHKRTGACEMGKAARRRLLVEWGGLRPLLRRQMRAL